MSSINTVLVHRWLRDLPLAPRRSQTPCTVIDRPMPYHLPATMLSQASLEEDTKRNTLLDKGGPEGQMEERLAAKLLGLAAVAANSVAADRVESEEDEEDRWSRQGSYEEGSEEDEEEDDGVGGKRKRMSPDDRKARNRERNRLHARKTRQRKKQHVQELQLKIWGLRQERQRLLQLSTDHRTAGVLLALSCSPKQCIQGAWSSRQESSPRLPPALNLSQTAATAASRSGRDWTQEVASHEDALRKITQEFESMDGTQHAGEEEETSISGGRGRAHSSASSSGGGRSGSRGVKGTLADRTALRRERNRMHAKRTRNRKKLFVEACSVMIDKMVSH